MPENKHLRFLLTLLYAGLGAAALWAAFRFLLPWTLPFLIALALAALLERPVRFLSERLRLPRRWAAGICTAFLGLAGLGGAALILWRLWYELTILLGRLPLLLSGLPDLIDRAERFFYRFLIALPPQIRSHIQTALAQMAEQGIALPDRLYTVLSSAALGIIDALPSAALFLLTTLLATYFFCAERSKLLAVAKGRLPTLWQTRLAELLGKLRKTLWGWLKAQLLLILITFGVLTLGLLILRVEPAFILAAVIALLDALPVLGTGVALLPWAAVSLCSGRLLLGVGLFALWLLTALLRTLLEPRLVGRQVGLSPLVTLIGVYVGFRSLGLAGMILAPLLLVLLHQLWHSGLLKKPPPNP